MFFFLCPISVQCVNIFSHKILNDRCLEHDYFKRCFFYYNMINRWEIVHLHIFNYRSYAFFHVSSCNQFHL